MKREMVLVLSLVGAVCLSTLFRKFGDVFFLVVHAAFCWSAGG